MAEKTETQKISKKKQTINNNNISNIQKMLLNKGPLKSARKERSQREILEMARAWRFESQYRSIVVLIKQLLSSESYVKSSILIEVIKRYKQQGDLALYLFRKRSKSV